MDYAAFLLVNVILFIRPSELVPELANVPLYYFAMLACLAFSVVPLMNLAGTEGIVKHPTVLFVLLMLALAAIALVVNVPEKAFDEELEYVKVITYFILFLAIIRTPERLQGVIGCVALCMAFTAVLGLLHFYEIIQIPNLKQMEEAVAGRDPTEITAMRRLRFTGVLDGPNEVAVFLGALTFLCSYQLMAAKSGAMRYLWIVPILLYLTCILLTRSRGGLLALLTGILVFAIYTVGRTEGAQGGLKAGLKAGVFAIFGIVPLLLVAGGRQTEFSASTNTAQTRFGEWSDWLLKFRENPVFGVSPQIIPRVRVNAGSANVSGDGPAEELLAHNSYLQAFADLGFLGGVAFIGAVGFALVTMHRYGFQKTMIFNADLARLQPFVIAAVACCAVGFFTLTINYLIPVYFILAIPVAYYGMTRCVPPIPQPSLSANSFVWLFAAAAVCLAAIYVIVLVMPKQ